MWKLWQNLRFLIVQLFHICRLYNHRRLVNRKWSWHCWRRLRAICDPNAVWSVRNITLSENRWCMYKGRGSILKLGQQRLESGYVLFEFVLSKKDIWNHAYLTEKLVRGFNPIYQSNYCFLTYKCPTEQAVLTIYVNTPVFCRVSYRQSLYIKTCCTLFILY